MTTIIEAIILGIIQGITEWLPVSSSGHLVIAQQWLGLEVPVIFDILLHLGSLAVVLFIFHKDIIKLCRGVLRRESYFLQYAAGLVVATIPIGLVGVFLNDIVKQAFGSLQAVGYGLLFTAAILFLSKYPKTKDKNLSWTSMIGIGALQAIAILPGVSRSGMTISAGLMQGVDREQSGRFSFLLFIPAILGATVVEFRNFTKIGEIMPLLIGVITTMIVGYFSLTWLLKMLKKDNFNVFAWYCLAVGIGILVLM